MKIHAKRMKINQKVSEKIFLLGYIFIVTGLIFSAFSHRVYDDPFITFRYAVNINEGLGFVYNPGLKILSTTSPLFAIILAIGKEIWSDLQLLASLIGSFGVAVGSVFLWQLGRIWKTPLVGWSGLLLYPTFPLLLNTLGSETPLFLAFVLAGLFYYAQRRYGLTVLLLAFSILMRSDGFLVAAILGVVYLWINRSKLRQINFWFAQPWGSIVIALGLLLLWHGFAWLYFGSPLPVTLAAKQAQGRMAISQSFAPGALTIAGWYAGKWQYWLELALVGTGLIYGFLKKQRWLLLLSWTTIYFIAYTLLGVTRYFWYYAPLVPGWIVAVGLGLAFVNDFSLPDRNFTFLKLDKIRRGFVILLLLTLFLTQILHVSKMQFTNDARFQIYRAVGEWLAENTAADATVGALEVGMIGFFSQRPMIDFAGLLQPEVSDQMKSDTTYDDTAVWATMTYQPQYLALIAGAHPQLEAKIVGEFCQLVKHFSGSQYDYRDMQIYFCQYD